MAVDLVHAVANAAQSDSVLVVDLLDKGRGHARFAASPLGKIAVNTAARKLLKETEDQTAQPEAPSPAGRIVAEPSVVVYIDFDLGAVGIRKDQLMDFGSVAETGKGRIHSRKNTYQIGFWIELGSWLIEDVSH